MAFFKYAGTQKQLLSIYNVSKNLPADPQTGQPQRVDANTLETLRDLRDAFKGSIGPYMLEMERLGRKAGEIEREHMSKPDTPKYMRAVKENNDAFDKLAKGDGEKEASVIVGDNVHQHVKTCVTDQKSWIATDDEAVDFALGCIDIVKNALEVKSVKEDKPEEPESTHEEAPEESETEETSEDEEPEPQDKKPTKLERERERRHGLPPGRPGSPLRR